MNTLKDYVTINFHLMYVDVLEVVILLMTYQIQEYRITGINELKTLAKHISFECKYKSDGRKYNLNQY